MTVMANYWIEHGCRIKLLTFDDGCHYPHHPLHNDACHRPLNIAGDSPNILRALFANFRRISILRTAIREENPEAVISFGTATNVLVLLASLFTGTSVVVSERTDPGKHAIGHIWKFLRRISYLRAARIIVQTRSVADRMALEGWRRVSVIPNPVPVANAAPDSRSHRSSRSKTVVAIGRLSSEKGFDILIEAFVQGAERHPEWSLVIWGEGPERLILEQLVKRLGLSERVTLPGITPNAQAVLRFADLFVLSSRFEGFPNVLCEAMACGLPVIAVDCPSGPAEIVRDGIDGMLTPPEDVAALGRALDEIMADEQRRIRLGRRAIEVTERFSVENIMEKWNELLQDLGTIDDR